jgi:hypothetical protein
VGLSFLETRQVQISEAFLIPDLVLYFNIFLLKKRPGKGFKKKFEKIP